MSSKLFKAVFAGAVTLGALLLPVTAAQAADRDRPCDGPGFGDGRGFGGGHGFGGGPFGGGMGFHDHGIGFFDDDDDFGFPGGGLGFHEDDDWNRPPTVIIVKVVKKNHDKSDSAGSTAGSSYSKPAAAHDGYHKKHKG